MPHPRASGVGGVGEPGPNELGERRAGGVGAFLGWLLLTPE